MGSLTLECPLCCTEKFNSLHGLKYHLLSIMDNLTCSSCNEKFDSVRKLIDHLDLECCGNKEGNPVVKNEGVDNTEGKSILAKALLKNQQGEEQMEEETISVNAEMEELEDSEDGDEGLYECSTCQVQFESIEEHIKEFHAGTEVVIQVSSCVSCNCRV